MLGGMLAGHKEGGGEVIKDNEKSFIEFYGSSSEEANEKHLEIMVEDISTNIEKLIFIEKRMT